ncbi:hypothetical protein BS47DRAFT_1249331, partial [Hydnum rufescens UP504]
MIGCELLVDISEALGIAKESTSPFGNINIIFAGDFCQLPPVKNTRLFSAVNKLTEKPSDSQTEDGQKKTKGKALWLQVTTVVLLIQSMHQAGPENQRFWELLDRLHFGKSEVVLTRPQWHNAPIITSQNAVKDALN